ncbi:MAG: acyl-CoA dehydrogenase, partial [Proteobacteria bacterium]|nr:acyl-CoA dehydrogenase [Pseudomonadota bacterium]
MDGHLIDPWHLDFVLWDVLDAERLFTLPRFSAHDRSACEAVLDAAAKLAREAFAPSYQALDAAEPRVENGRVVLPASIGEALGAFALQGFSAMAAEPEDGGLGLPRTIANAAFLKFQAANISIANYAMLTASAAELIAHHGTSEQKRRYLAPMLDGRFFGTMALSEPQAGSSLGDIRTCARPRGDGTYALTGNKMWISGADHEMAE